MATRRNVPANSNGNGHLPPSLQVGTPTTPDDDEAPQLVSSSNIRSSTSSSRTTSSAGAFSGISNGGIAPPRNFHVLAARPSENPNALDAWEKQYYAGESRALSGIACRAFLLGNSVSLGLATTIYYIYNGSIYWRVPAFVVALSIFHFLEFWTTARYNTPNAQVSSFLLSSNGSAYTIAHTCATIECLITSLYKTYGHHIVLPFTLPKLAPSWTSLIPAALFPEWDNKVNIILGLFLIILGQTIRTLAMAQAGQSFNHVVQVRKQNTHALITHGVYSLFRHPSYFGFFWWGLGTQLLLGNTVCFLGYAAVLWLFFKRRIEGEEKYLVNFFKEDYVRYRKKVGVWIPFIW